MTRAQTSSARPYTAGSAADFICLWVEQQRQLETTPLSRALRLEGWLSSLFGAHALHLRAQGTVDWWRTPRASLAHLLHAPGKSPGGAWESHARARFSLLGEPLSPISQLCAQVDEWGALARPWGEREHTWLVEACSLLRVVREEELCLGMIAQELRAGRQHRARPMAEQLRGGTQRAALRLVRSGVWRGSFVGGLENPGAADQYLPSVTLLEALVARGAPVEAGRVMARLSARDREAARPAWAVLAYREAGLGHALAALRGSWESTQRAGRARLAREAIALARWDEASELLEALAGTQAGEEGQLCLALGLRARGLVREAARVVEALPAREGLAGEKALFAISSLRDAGALGEAEGRLAQLRRWVRGRPPEEGRGYGAPLWERVLETWITLQEARSFASASAPLGRWERAQLVAAPRLLRLLARALADRDPGVLRPGSRAWPYARHLRADAFVLALAWARRSALWESLREGVAAGLAAWDGEQESPEGAFTAGAVGDPWRGPGSRAWYAAGAAISPGAGQRRGALLRAARREARGAASSDAAARPLWEARARGLAHLATPQARELLASLVRAPGPLARPSFLALAAHDPGAARALFLEHIGALGTALLDQVAGLFGEALSRSLVQLWEARRALASTVEADHWIAALVQQEPLHGLGALNPARLTLLRTKLTEDPEASPGALLAELRGAWEALVSVPARQLVQRLAREPENIALLRALAPAPHEVQTPWEAGRWFELFRALGELPLSPDPARIAEARRYFRRGPHARERLARLLRGEAPLGARPLQEGRYLLRGLDKREHLMYFLRVTDAVTCCFSSWSKDYTSGRNGRRQLLELWLDPLSFAFGVERADGEPAGFVFGSLGLRGDAPAVLLNGLYLRRQRRTLREEILRALEDEFARPLGAAWIGLSNRNGGTGQLPREYCSARERIWMVRWRALCSRGGAPVRTVYDDISTLANAPFSIRFGLWWKRLVD